MNYHLHSFVRKYDLCQILTILPRLLSERFVLVKKCLTAWGINIIKVMPYSIRLLINSIYLRSQYSSDSAAVGALIR